LGDAFENDRVGSDGNVVFGEVDAGFEQCYEVNQFALDGLEAMGERAFELLRGDFGLK